jgi:hypothetical protein
MNLNERYKELRGKTEQSMGQLVVVQQAMSNRAAAGVDGAPTATGSPVPVNEGENQSPPSPPGLASPQVHIQPHGQARQAEAVRNQVPIFHRLAAPAAAATAAPRPGIPFPIPSAAMATTSTPARAANPFTFTAPSYRQPMPQVAQVQQVQQQYLGMPQATQMQQVYQQYPGPSYCPGPGWPHGSGQGFGNQPNAPYGAAQFSSPYGGTWNQPQQGDGGARQLVRVPAIPLPVQPYKVQAASSWVTNCWPILPGDRMQGIFSFSQSGEVLTVRAPRDGEDWMKLNPREDDQRWGAINAAMAVLASSKTTPDRMMLDPYEALVQPTQFIELLRKTMPMTEAQLDMFTTMHDSMFRRLNALEMLHKGGQRAVDELLRPDSTAWRSERQMRCRRPRGRTPMTVAAAAAAAMATRPGVGLDKQEEVVSLGTRHPLLRKRQVRPSTLHASSSSHRGLNVESATSWATGRKIAVQVSTP